MKFFVKKNAACETKMNAVLNSVPVRECWLQFVMLLQTVDEEQEQAYVKNVDDELLPEESSEK